jgi:hypothetical protein
MSLLTGTSEQLKTVADRMVHPSVTDTDYEVMTGVLMAAAAILFTESDNPACTEQEWDDTCKLAWRMVLSLRLELSMKQ